ncbi:hypothetical protein C8R47DRAFT_1085108 [Mycena vitilis]|nr:hypothetical protein C8R47DRAFT_1085108 [Mycena vitilis]
MLSKWRNYMNVGLQVDCGVDDPEDSIQPTGGLGILVVNLGFDRYGDWLGFGVPIRIDIISINSATTQIPECHGLHLQSVLESEFDFECASRPKQKIQHAGRMDSAWETKTSSFFRQKFNQIVQNQLLGAFLKWNNAGLGSCLGVLRSRDPAALCHAKNVTATSACDPILLTCGRRHHNLLPWANAAPRSGVFYLRLRQRVDLVSLHLANLKISSAIIGSPQLQRRLTLGSTIDIGDNSLYMSSASWSATSQS